MEMIRNNRIEIGYINEYRKNTNLFSRHEASLGLMELCQHTRDSPVKSRIARPYFM
jgi:hypothetical protein